MNVHRNTVMNRALPLYNGTLEYASKCLKPIRTVTSGLEEGRGGTYIKRDSLPWTQFIQHPEEAMEVIKLHNKNFYIN